MPWCEAANLVECVPGWWGVAPTSVPLINAVKGVACEQRSSHLGMQLMSCVHLCKFIISSAVVALAVSLSRYQYQNGKKKQLR